MYLERIEMQGFKSFADKTVIEFDKGITAVVGPNGSGKSNLSEAIRWVLGEQSAKSVRASKMEDIIFNGTQDRPPVNLAKVTLVLNNEDRYLDYDFNEIQIARSYNRNGDSNYYINNQSVRLKDIVDLLLDSGLGKDSFSMISQGEVEQIFLNKPEERRLIFEEAAGVQKYQHRKHEANLKLNRSNDHLSRVEDIIYELDGQLKPLKKQKDAALVYQELSQELKENEVSLYKVEIDQYQSEWQKCKDDQSQLTAEQTQLETDINKLSEKLTQTQTEENTLAKIIDESINQYQDEIQELERKRGRLQVLIQELNYQKSGQKERLENHRKQVQEAESLTIEIDGLEKELEQKLIKHNELKTQLEELTEQKTLTETGSQESIERVRNQAIERYQEEASLNNQNKQNEKQISIDQARLDKLQTQTKESAERIESEEKIYLELLSNFKSHQNEFDHLQITNQGQNQSIQDLQTKREQLQNQLFQTERKLQQAQNQVTNLENMQESYSGYYGGVQAVMKAGIEGVEGTIAELIRVDEIYQTAIDTALGTSLQHIVVRDDESARRAINYLKDKRAGRATFLPRTNIKSRSLDSSLINALQNTPGFVAVASDVVEFSENNRPIIENLLGTTVVCAQMTNAQQMARNFNFRLRIVTLDGEILYPGGSISGGGKRRQSTMLSQQTNLEKAKKEVNNLKVQQSEIEKELTSFQEMIEKSRKELDENTNKLNKMSGMSQVFQEKINQSKQKLDNLSYEQKANKSEIEFLENSIKEAQAALTEGLNQVKLIKEEINQLNQELQNLNLNAEDRQKKLAQLDEELRDLSTQEAVLKVEINQTKENIGRQKGSLKEIQNFIRAYEDGQANETLTVEELSLEIDQVKLDIEKLEKSSRELDELIKSNRQKRTELNELVGQLESEQKNYQTKNQSNYQKLARLDAQIEKLESYIDNRLDYLNQEYHLSYEAAREISHEIESTDEVKNLVRDLKRKINRLGPINLQAIDDFDQLNERYQKLLDQQNDLLTAIGQLEETVSEMDKEVITRFSATFNEINEKFQVTFRKLFGGGSAELELTDPSDLLTTGVDIVAQPPGKKRQNLALLSGGERALTALALLFAILEVRPTPFVVLDEVEAALDDANVYRYGEYLKSFSNQTQFIVITHRKGTMEAADILYGVTMQESGVSKMASVRLSDAEELID